MKNYSFSIKNLFYSQSERYFCKNSKFRELIKNKRVALVGPANYLTLFNWGKIIDNYDIVARINRGIELIDNHKNALGTRTDILYNCLIEKSDNGGVISLRNLKKNNVKWVCSQLHSDVDGNVFKNRLHPEVKFLTILKLRYFLNLHIHEYKNYSFLNRQLKCRANTGFSAIFDLLDNDAKEVFVSGFSFYLDSFIKGYKKGSKMDEEEFAKNCFNSKRHNQKNQWNYLKSIKNNPKLTFDPILNEVLNLNSLEKKEFLIILKKYI